MFGATVEFEGRVAKDPTVSTTQNGHEKVFFSVAVSRGKNKSGEDMGADFIPCTVWRGNGDKEPWSFRQAKESQKGDLVRVSGKLRIDSIKDDEGNFLKGNYVSVNVGDFNNYSWFFQRREAAPTQRTQAPSDAFLDYSPAAADDDSDIPF